MLSCCGIRAETNLNPGNFKPFYDKTLWPTWFKFLLSKLEVKPEPANLTSRASSPKLGSFYFRYFSCFRRVAASSGAISKETTSGRRAQPVQQSIKVDFSQPQLLRHRDRAECSKLGSWWIVFYCKIRILLHLWRAGQSSPLSDWLIMAAWLETAWYPKALPFWTRLGLNLSYFSKSLRTNYRPRRSGFTCRPLLSIADF